MHLTERCRSVCRAGAWGRWMSMFTPDGVGVRVIVCLRYPTGRTNALCLSTVRVCVCIRCPDQEPVGTGVHTCLGTAQ